MEHVFIMSLSGNSWLVVIKDCNGLIGRKYIFTHLKLFLAASTQNFKWMKLNYMRFIFIISSSCFILGLLQIVYI